MANYTDPIGAVLMFGDDLIAKMNKLDSQFALIEKHSADMTKTIAQAFNAPGGMGMDTFRNQLDQIKDKITSIGDSSKLAKFNTLGTAIAKTTSESASLVSELERVKQELDKTAESALKAANSGNKFSSKFVDETKIESMENRVKRLQQALSSGKALNRNGNFTGSKAGSLTEELRKQYEEEEAYWQKRIATTIKSQQKIVDANLRAAQQVHSANKAAAEQIYLTDINLMNKRMQLSEKIASLSNKRTVGIALSPEEEELLKRYQREVSKLDKELKALKKEYPLLYNEAKKAFGIQEIEARIQAQRKLNQETERYNQEIRSTPKGALEYSSKEAHSIEQRRQAINHLRQALETLDPRDENFLADQKNITQEIRRQEAAVKGLSGNINNLRTAQRGLLDIGGQLRGMFMSVFSLYQVTGFIKKMVQVRGEFELQHRALQAIIQDIDKADKLWTQITELAVESPFRVKELVTYTKQLAAYRIETDKIFDVTKRLADVSAGLGVDMNRLILAYGQVKAANYLRGQELRQFSEAGINILGELAAQFSEVEGVAVSTGEVFDRVSKRMVKFEDVAKVFEKLTDEGGIFYEMQEKQAATLQGRISNLKDSLDLMYDDIGKANSGVLKDSVDYLKGLIDNWRGWMPFAIAGLTALIAKWAGMKVAMAIINKSFQNMAANMVLGLKYLTNMFSKQGRAANQLANALSQGAAGAGAWGAALSALAATITIVIGLIQKARREMKELNKIQDEGAAEAMKLESSFHRLAKEATDASNTYSEQQKALSKLKSIYGDILPAEQLTIEYLKSQKDGYKEVTDEIYRYIEAKTLEKKVDFIAEEYSDKIQKSKRRFTSVIKGVLQSNGIGYSDADIKIISKEIENAIKRGDINTDVDLAFALNEVISQYFGINERQFAQHYRDTGHYSKFVNRAFKLIDNISKMQKKIREIEEEGEDTQLFGNWKNYREDMSVAETSLQGFSAALEEYANSTEENLEKAASDLNKYLLEYNKTVRNLPSPEELKNNPFAFDDVINQYNTDQLEKLLDKYKGKDGMVGQVNELKKKLDGLKLTKPMEEMRDFMIQTANTYGTSLKTMNELFNAAADGMDNLEKKIKENLEQNKKNIDGFVKLTTSRYIFTEEMKEQAEQDNIALNILLDYIDRHNNENKTTGRGNDIMSKRIELIKKMNAEYEKLREQFDEDDTISRVMKSYDDAWKEIMGGTGLKMSDFFKTKQGTADMMKELRPFAKKESQALERAIGDELVEIDIDVKVKNRDEFKNELDNLFEGYNLWQELDKMGVPPSLAQELFDVQATSLDKIADYIKEKKDDLTGTLGEDAVREALEKIHKMEQEQNIANLKEYVKYLHEAMNERVKVQSETIRKISNINKLAENEQISDDTRNLMIKGAREEEQKELNRLLWENFKSSDVYVKMFEDLDKQSTASLRHMKDQLEALKGKMGEDPIHVKAITEQMEKLDKVILNRNPFTKGVQNLFSTVEQLRKEGKDENSLIEQLIGGTADEQKLQQYADILQLAVDIQRSGGDMSLIDENALSEAVEYLSKTNGEGMEWDNYEQMYEAIKKVLQAQKDSNEETRENINLWEKAKQSAEAMARTIEDWSHQLQSLGSDVFELIQSLGGAGNEEAKALKETVDSLMDVGTSIITLAAGIGSNDPVKMIQGTFGALSALIKAVTKLNQLHDARLTDRIDSWKEKVDELNYTYEKLQKTFERAYDVDELNTSSNQMLNSINAQIEAYQRMRAAERAKKNTDEDAIKEYNREIEELTEKAEEVTNNLLTSLGGVSRDEYSSQAEAFADAWLSAFNETGDGMDALNEKWDEIINNMIKRQLVTRGLSKYMEGALDFLNGALDDSIMSREEYATLMEMVKRASEGMNEYMKGIAGTIGFLGTGETKLSGLQEGIQGMTEQTAEVLAAYANSLRLIESQQLSVLQDLATRVLSSDGAANPILAELRQQTSVIQEFKSALDSVIERGSAGGRAIRIVS